MLGVGTQRPIEPNERKQRPKPARTEIVILLYSFTFSFGSSRQKSQPIKATYIPSSGVSRSAASMYPARTEVSRGNPRLSQINQSAQPQLPHFSQSRQSHQRHGPFPSPMRPAVINKTHRYTRDALPSRAGTPRVVVQSTTQCTTQISPHSNLHIIMVTHTRIYKNSIVIPTKCYHLLYILSIATAHTTNPAHCATGSPAAPATSVKGCELAKRAGKESTYARR